MIVVKEISVDETYPLRHKVLRPHQPFETCKYDTDKQEGSFHVGVFSGSKLICVVSFCLEKHPDLPGTMHYRLQAMATLSNYRKQGAGRFAVEFGEKKIRNKSARYLWCKGRTEVQTYYEKLGFSPLGEVFDYPGLGPHITMVKEIF